MTNCNNNNNCCLQNLVPGTAVDSHLHSEIKHLHANLDQTEFWLSYVDVMASRLLSDELDSWVMGLIRDGFIRNGVDRARRIGKLLVASGYGPAVDGQKETTLGYLNSRGLEGVVDHEGHLTVYVRELTTAGIEIARLWESRFNEPNWRVVDVYKGQIKSSDDPAPKFCW